MTNNILFDDWQARRDGAFKRRKSNYIVCFIACCILLFVSIICIFASWYSIVFFVLALLAFLAIYYEWLKIKNNHLIIKSDQIEITNKFNKTTIYKVHIHELTLVLKHSINYRSGGIIMQFYDVNGQFVCEYEDMINTAALWRQEQTKWEKSLKSLGIKIIDKSEIIKN